MVEKIKTISLQLLNDTLPFECDFMYIHKCIHISPPSLDWFLFKQSCAETYNSISSHCFVCSLKMQNLQKSCKYMSTNYRHQQ